MICENCKREHDGSYGSGRFCSQKCSRGFATKSKRKEINEKVSKSLKGSGHADINKTCEFCGKEFTVWYNKRNQRFCSAKCTAKFRANNEDIKNNISKSLKKYYKNPKTRNRLRDIGRKGGFGKRGYTKGGIHYQSNLEKKCFELLEDLNIK
ncbi:MAG: hypothetical protein JXM74_03310, partial [Fusobacteriaceae bacterium]|nr:hypothetical protein [Fusobacteriaceae bacterium]